MLSPDSLSSAVKELVPIIYEDVRETAQSPLLTDMSHSNRCDLLTLSLCSALNVLGYSQKRELHQDDKGNWHYLIVHAGLNELPTADDLVTDLNPWQFEVTPRNSGYFHGERTNLESLLINSQAPEWFVSLRAIRTITQAHTTSKNPFIREL